MGRRYGQEKCVLCVAQQLCRPSAVSWPAHTRMEREEAWANRSCFAFRKEKKRCTADGGMARSYRSVASRQMTHASASQLIRRVGCSWPCELLSSVKAHEIASGQRCWKMGPTEIFRGLYLHAECSSFKRKPWMILVSIFAHEDTLIISTVLKPCPRILLTKRIFVTIVSCTPLKAAHNKGWASGFREMLLNCRLLRLTRRWIELLLWKVFRKLKIDKTFLSHVWKCWESYWLEAIGWRRNYSSFKFRKQSRVRLLNLHLSSS